MDKIKKTLTAKRTLPIRVNESLVSMILGVVVVVIIGLLAFNYFRNQRADLTKNIPNQTLSAMQQKTDSEKKKQTDGQILTAQNTVALPVTHVVSANENLWSIAENYYRSGYNYIDIVQANGLADPNHLEIGQKLTIPKVESRQPLTIAGAVAPQITLSRINGNNYQVQKGDSLWQIALRAYGDGYRWSDIAKANNLAKPDLIFSGNVLVLPRP